MNYSISSLSRLLEVEVSGAVTKAGILEFWESLEAHPAYPAAVGALVRLASGMSWDLTQEEARRLGADVQRLRPLRWAIVSPDLLSFGMSRMLATLAEGAGTYHIFDCEETARKWLSASLNEDPLIR